MNLAAKHFTGNCCLLCQLPNNYLDKMIGNWKNKCLEKLEQKFGGKFPQLFTGGISREKKCIPDIP